MVFPFILTPTFPSVFLTLGSGSCPLKHMCDRVPSINKMSRTVEWNKLVSGAITMNGGLVSPQTQCCTGTHNDWKMRIDRGGCWEM